MYGFNAILIIYNVSLLSLTGLIMCKTNQSISDHNPSMESYPS